MRQRDPPPPRVGGEDIRRGSKGKMEMKFMVPMQFLSLVLGGNTDSSVAGLNLFVFWCDDHGGEAVVGCVIFLVSHTYIVKITLQNEKKIFMYST